MQTYKKKNKTFTPHPPFVSASSLMNTEKRNVLTNSTPAPSFQQGAKPPGSAAHQQQNEPTHQKRKSPPRNTTSHPDVQAPAIQVHHHYSSQEPQKYVERGTNNDSFVPFTQEPVHYQNDNTQRPQNHEIVPHSSMDIQPAPNDNGYYENEPRKSRDVLDIETDRRAVQSLQLAAGLTDTQKIACIESRVNRLIASVDHIHYMSKYAYIRVKELERRNDLFRESYPLMTKEKKARLNIPFLYEQDYYKPK